MANQGEAAGAAAVAAAIVNINNMDEYLERTIGVANQGMRDKLITNGFTDLDALVRKKRSGVKEACLAIRSKLLCLVLIIQYYERLAGTTL